jgi:hypothetical protein
MVMVGILPTLRAEELRLAALSDAARFRVLNNGIRRLRQEPFRIRIDGADPLELAADDIGLEGANTSFQVHLRVDPEHFASHFNAAQLAIGPVLAVAGNSPLGHRLWEETRVALFKQALDDRDAAGRSSRRICRVAFGTGWITTGAMELLEESVRLHEPVLPVLSGEYPLERVAAGQVPALEELRLHQSTVWRWNRAIYDPAGGGHLRIEAQALPAGPTGGRHVGQRRLPARPHPVPGPRRRCLGPPDPVPASPPQLLPRRPARPPRRAGLATRPGRPDAAGPGAPADPAAAAGRLPGAGGGRVEPEEAGGLLAVVEARAATEQTGAVWQRRALAALEPQLGREQALAAMLERYLEHQRTGDPVHTCPTPVARSYR